MTLPLARHNVGTDGPLGACTESRAVARSIHTPNSKRTPGEATRVTLVVAAVVPRSIACWRLDRSRARVHHARRRERRALAGAAAPPRPPAPLAAATRRRPLRPRPSAHRLTASHIPARPPLTGCGPQPDRPHVVAAAAGVHHGAAAAAAAAANRARRGECGGSRGALRRRGGGRGHQGHRSSVDAAVGCPWPPKRRQRRRLAVALRRQPCGGWPLAAAPAVPAPPVMPPPPLVPVVLVASAAPVGPSLLTSPLAARRWWRCRGHCRRRRRQPQRR